jgi:uncharacterized protein (TIGR02118 family)
MRPYSVVARGCVAAWGLLALTAWASDVGPLPLKDTKMYKAIALLKAKAGMPKEKFIEYYEGHHVPLILRLMPQIADYRRNYAQTESAYLAKDISTLDFDAVTELWYRTKADYESAAALLKNPAILKEIADDEEHFLDRGKTRMFVVEEYVSTELIHSK